MGTQLALSRNATPNLEKSFFWLDYTSLRQRESDFDPELIVALVAKIGWLYASIAVGRSEL